MISDKSALFPRPKSPSRGSSLGTALPAGESPEDVWLMVILTQMPSQEARGTALDWPLPPLPGNQEEKEPVGGSLGCAAQDRRALASVVLAVLCFLSLGLCQLASAECTGFLCIQ